MTTPEVLARIEAKTGTKARRAGTGWDVRCPAHDDEKASLSVGGTGDGKTLLHCHAGCTVEAIAEAAGFEIGDLFETSAETAATIIAVYGYTDENGGLLFEVVRFSPKDFRQRRPDGNGGHVWNLDGVRRVPYRLPELVAAANGNGTVFVCEGEKAVDALASRGVTATCSPGGAGKWRDEYATYFEGVPSVVVIADRDEPGVKHARTVARSLAAVVPDVRIVQAAVERDHADIVDHLAAGLHADDLVPLVGDDREQGAAEPFAGRTHAEVLQLELPEQRQLIADLIPIGAVGTIAGVPETHKSWLAQAIAVRVAAGTGTMLGCRVVYQANVGYFWQDDSEREEAERIKAFESKHPTTGQLPIRWHLNEGVQLPRDLARLRSTIETHKLGLIVLDSFYNFTPGINLKDEEAEQIVAQLKADISDATGCTVLIVDHMPWATETNRGRLRAYGGVFKNAATRFGIYIDAVGKTLSIEARGNNITGFKKTPAYWDNDQLELRLVEASDHNDKLEERAAQVLEWLEANPGTHSKNAIRKAVKGRAEITDQALFLLKARDTVQSVSATNGTHPYNTRKSERWIASIHTGSLPPPTVSLLDGTHPDTVSPAHTDDNRVPSPIGGHGDVRTHQNEPPNANEHTQTPLPGDNDFQAFIEAAFYAGDITATEAYEHEQHHQHVLAGRSTT